MRILSYINEYYDLFEGEKCKLKFSDKTMHDVNVGSATVFNGFFTKYFTAHKDNDDEMKR